MDKRYKIRVKTLLGDILTFRNVRAYRNEDGLLYFIDEKTMQPKTFSISNCEIEVEN